MKATTSPPSTDDGLVRAEWAAALTRAIDPRTIKGAIERLGPVLGAATLDEVEGKLRDVAFVQGRLASASGAALAGLEMLIDAAGALDEPVFAALASARLGIGPDRFPAFLSAVASTGLVLAVRISSAYGRPSETRTQVGLLARSAPTVALALAGLTLPTLVPDEGVVSPPSVALRDRVAVLAATAHANLRANASGEANLAGLKKLAALLGRTTEEVGGIVEGGSRSGALGVRDGLIVPTLDRLLEEARGELEPEHGFDAWLAARVPRERWLSLDALARARVRDSRAAFGRAVYAYATEPCAGGPEDVLSAARAIEASPRVTLLDHEGARFVRAPGLGAGGDGHVTPSFEILLGLLCEPALAATIALSAEPVRFDRVLTFKLTPAALATGLSLGLTAPDLLAALARVGRHAVPENVRATVAGWADAVRFSTARRVWAVALPTPADADRAQRVLGAAVVDRPGPQVLLLADDPRLEESAYGEPPVSLPATHATALARAGVRVSGEVGRSRRARDTTASAARPASVRVLPPTCAPALRDRFTDDAARSFPLPVVVPPEARDESGEPFARLTELAAGRPPASARALLSIVTTLWRSAWPAYARWLGALSASDRELAAFTSRRAPFRLLGWLILERVRRDAMLERSKSVSELFEAAACVRPGPGILSTDGLRAVQACQTRGVQRFLEQMDEEEELLLELEDHDDEPGLEDLDGASLEDYVEQIARSSRARASVAAAPRAAVPGTAKKEPAPLPAGQRPRPADLPEQPAPDVARAVERLAKSQVPAWIRVRSKSQGDRVVRFLVERLLVRGSETTVLGTDQEEEHGRSFPLTNVVSVRVD